MAALFFYGTLCHRPLLNAVLGPVDHLKLCDAVLAGHRGFRVNGAGHAKLVQTPGSKLGGVFAEGLTRTDLARLDFYMGAIGYLRTDHQVRAGGETRMAQAYVARSTAGETGKPWHLADWETDWRAISLRAAEEIMASFGKISVAEITTRYSQILQRAASGARAASKPDRSYVGVGYDRSKVSIRQLRRPYTNFFAIQEQDISFAHFDGTQSETVTRAAFVGGDAVIVLPYDPVRDRVMIIEQFRFGVFVRGDPHPWALEAIAGRIDAGETPPQTALREAREETGLEIRELLPVAQYYPGAGAVSDYLYSFIGLVDLPDGAAGVSGLQTEAEDIKSHILEFDELMGLISGAEVEDVHLILSAHWLARQRDRIRQTA